MLSLFKRMVLGGRTGKREAAWFVLILWSAGAVYLFWKEAQGIEMANSFALLTAALVPVGVFFAGAYGMEWHSAQSKWAGQPSSEVEVDQEFAG